LSKRSKYGGFEARVLAKQAGLEMSEPKKGSIKPDVLSENHFIERAVLDDQNIVEVHVIAGDRSMKRDCLKDDSREPRVPGEVRLHKVCGHLENRIVEPRFKTKGGVIERSAPMKDRLLEECRTQYRSRTSRRSVAVNPPWDWRIAKFRSAEIDI
jgi:hypothetical protein